MPVVRCQDCGDRFEAKKGTKRRCATCFVTDRRRRQRAYDRRIYEEQRAGTPRLGDAIRCAACDQQVIRTASIKRYCSLCAKAAISRAARQKKIGLRANPVCACCSQEIVAQNSRRKYCDTCRETGAPVLKRLKERRSEDPAFVLRNAIRTSIYCALRRGKAWRKWQDILGYTADDLVRHLERQFTAGMSWSNYGDWHIDHIVPLASFRLVDANDPAVRTAWGLPNLRPLWAEKNLTKSSHRTLLC